MATPLKRFKTPSKSAFKRSNLNSSASIYSAYPANGSSDEVTSMQQLISLSRDLSSASSLTKNFENKISKLTAPSPTNIAEFLACLIGEQADQNVADNIYLLSLLFPYLEYKKEKKGDIKLQFRSSHSKVFEKMPKSFNCNTTLKVLAQFGVTAKSQPAIVKTLKVGITETKKQVSVVCFAIVMTAIQDGKDFKHIQRLMKKVVSSELLQEIKLSDAYLKKLKDKLKNHEYRAAFANCLVETLAAYNTKQLIKKCPLTRQMALVRMVKKLFYLRTSEIHAFMDKVQNWMGGKLFSIGMDLLLDKESLPEIARWFPSFWQISQSNPYNPTKKRVSLAYASLIASDPLEKHKLSANQRTVSFFFGVLANPSEFMTNYKLNFDPALLDSRYYALGLLLRNYNFVNELEIQLKMINIRQLTLTDKYLADCFDFLNDAQCSKEGVALGNPLLFKEGLRRLKDRPLFSQVGKRQTLWAVSEFMDQLTRIRNEQRPEVRKVLVLNLRLKSRFEQVASKCDEPMVSNLDIATAKAERNILSEIQPKNLQPENVFPTKSRVDMKSERENAMSNREKLEAMELSFESDNDQPDRKRFPLVDLNGRVSSQVSSQNSQATQLLDDDYVTVD